MPLSSSILVSAVASLALVTGLVLLAARLARTTGLGRLAFSANSTRRLVVQDSLALDRSRRLLVIRCDGKDVLLLTGGQTDLVVGWLAPAPTATEAGA